MLQLDQADPCNVHCFYTMPVCCMPVAVPIQVRRIRRSEWANSCLLAEHTCAWTPQSFPCVLPPRISTCSCMTMHSLPRDCPCAVRWCTCGLCVLPVLIFHPGVCMCACVHADVCARVIWSADLQGDLRPLSEQRSREDVKRCSSLRSIIIIISYSVTLIKLLYK